MDRRIVWTERASGDFEAIVRYIARKNPNAASRIASGIYERTQGLLEFPESGSILDELRENGWRKLIFRRWKIVYALRDDQIIIGRIWPAAMGEADFETPL